MISATLGAGVGTIDVTVPRGRGAERVWCGVVLPWQLKEQDDQEKAKKKKRENDKVRGKERRREINEKDNPESRVGLS
jgi:hypothetical protein